MSKNNIEISQIILYSPASLCWKDKDLTYQGCSRSFAQAAGYNDPLDIIGKTDSDLLWTPDCVDYFNQLDKQVLKTGTSVLDKEITLCFLIDGLVEKKRFIMNVVKLHDKGQGQGILYNFCDLTKFDKKSFEINKDVQLTTQFLKQISRERMGSNASFDKPEEYIKAICDYYDSIIACMPGNTYWLNRDCILLGGNDNLAKMFGLKSRSELIGLTYDEMSHLANWTEGQGEIFKNAEIEIMNTGRAKLNQEEPPVMIDGKVKHYLSNKVPLYDGQENIIGVVGTSIDITEKIDAEKALLLAKEKAEISNQVKTDFIANMSHDIRTPITGLIGMVQDLLYAAEDARVALQSEDLKSETKKDKLFQSLIEHTKRNNHVMLLSIGELLKLCNEILEITRLESGASQPHSEAFNIREVVQHNINLLKPVAEHKKLKLSVKIDKNIPLYLQGLYSYLDRTLLNLISNALKFTKTGSVTVFVNLADALSEYKISDVVKLIIQVRDTGIGIPTDKFDMIFEHFSRLTASYEGVYKGSGLGLYTVKKYIEAMQGDIIVESQIDKGTCFTITIPLTVDDHADVSSEGQPSFAPSILGDSTDLMELTKSSDNGEVVVEENKSAVRVLVVEDNKAAGMMVSMALKRLHCQVDIAKTGLEGVEKAQQKSYDLILMDVGLPDIDGLEVTRRIRALPSNKCKQPPIVALTGHVTDDKHSDCIASGMNDVITKPAPPLMLESLLKRFVWKIGQDEGVVEETPDQSAQKEVLPVIDWEGCVIAVGDDPDVAKQLLAICSDELKATKQVLEEGYQEKDLIKLRAELHKCLGGVVYLRLPRLEAGLRAFQAVTHDEPNNAKKFSAAYHELQNAIQAYQEQWDILSKEK